MTAPGLAFCVRAHPHLDASLSVTHSSLKPKRPPTTHDNGWCYKTIDLIHRFSANDTPLMSAECGMLSAEWRCVRHLQNRNEFPTKQHRQTHGPLARRKKKHRRNGRNIEIERKRRNHQSPRVKRKHEWDSNWNRIHRIGGFRFGVMVRFGLIALVWHGEDRSSFATGYSINAARRECL